MQTTVKSAQAVGGTRTCWCSLRAEPMLCLPLLVQLSGPRWPPSVCQEPTLSEAWVLGTAAKHPEFFCLLLKPCGAFAPGGRLSGLRDPGSLSWPCPQLVPYRGPSVSCLLCKGPSLFCMPRPPSWGL